MQSGFDVKPVNSLVAGFLTQFEYFYLGLFIAAVYMIN